MSQALLDQMINEWEDQIQVWPEEGDCALAPTGEPYEALVLGGVKLEGENTLCVARTAEVAIRVFKWTLQEYAKGKWNGTLYWRARPDLDSTVMWPNGTTWSVYSRLIISDKPVIRQARIFYPGPAPRV